MQPNLILESPDSKSLSQNFDVVPFVEIKKCLLTSAKITSETYTIFDPARLVNVPAPRPRPFYRIWWRKIATKLVSPKCR